MTVEKAAYSAGSLWRWGGKASRALTTLLVGGALCYFYLFFTGQIATRLTTEKKDTENTHEDHTVVDFPEAKWSAAGIRLEPATSGLFSERAWRSGRLALDETRIAHLSPMVEGIVREVNVRLGQDVQAGEVLAVLDCREVGQAKLDLVKMRLAAEHTRAGHAWTETVSRNAGELVEAMTRDSSMAQLEKQFKDRSIGDLREKLMTAYSRRLQAKAHYASVDQADGRGSIPQATFIRMKADYEAAEAAYRAICEEVKFQTGQQVRASTQKLREAETSEALSKTQLLMLGYSRQEVAAMDPIAEGPRVSLYPLRAPFAGTVIEQHAVLSERVGPQMQMFQIADLSSLWLQADVFEKDLPLVEKLRGGKVRFRTADRADAVAEAEVFYTGDVVDKTTRAVTLTARVPNRGRALKAGMFVEVELVREGSAVVQVPSAAIQRLGTQPFVFVHEKGERFRRADVTVGRSSGQMTEVLDGLKAGQSVVVTGGFILKSELLRDQLAGD
ncbi:MAG: efflux RND transporter periplasmic adaptor subunit [Gemmataceae bacterium]